MTKVEIIELYIRELECQVGLSPARNMRISILKEELSKSLLTMNKWSNYCSCNNGIIVCQGCNGEKQGGLGECAGCKGSGVRTCGKCGGLN